MNLFRNIVSRARASTLVPGNMPELFLLNCGPVFIETKIKLTCGLGKDDLRNLQAKERF